MARKRGELGNAIRAARMRKQQALQNAAGATPPAGDPNANVPNANVAANPPKEQASAHGRSQASHASHGRAQAHREDRQSH